MKKSIFAEKCVNFFTILLARFVDCQGRPVWSIARMAINNDPCDAMPADREDLSIGLHTSGTSFSANGYRLPNSFAKSKSSSQRQNASTASCDHLPMYMQWSEIAAIGRKILLDSSAANFS